MIGDLENEFTQRKDDERIKEIIETVKEIRNILQAENGVCVRLSVCERSQKSTQNELTEMKENQKWVIGIILIIASVIGGFVAWLVGILRK